MNVAIIGASGYGGAELMRILHHHPKVKIQSFHTSSQSGSELHDTYPHLQHLFNKKLESIDLEKMKEEVDLVFCATPSGVSSTLVPQLVEHGLKVIDLSGDYRLKNSEDYKEWYKLDPVNEKVLDQAVYGLTEWLETDLSKAQVISNPGCFPTAALLGLAPLVKNNLIDERSIIIDAKTGVSGAGRSPSSATHFSETNENFKVYKVNAHQHTPEIEQMLTHWNRNMKPVTFSAHLAPITRGIMATMYAAVKSDVNTEMLFDLYNKSYQDSFFVRIKDPGYFPSTKEVYGSNFCDISISYDERTNRITVISVIDNLMKGAAGQAVQNMNKMLGMDEKTGLDFVPVYP